MFEVNEVEILRAINLFFEKLSALKVSQEGYRGQDRVKFRLLFDLPGANDSQLQVNYTFDMSQYRHHGQSYVLRSLKPLHEDLRRRGVI